MNKIDKMLVKNYAILVVADRLGDRIIPERLIEEVEIKVADMAIQLEELQKENEELKEKIK